MIEIRKDIRVRIICYLRKNELSEDKLGTNDHNRQGNKKPREKKQFRDLTKWIVFFSCYSHLLSRKIGSVILKRPSIFENDI